MLGAIVAIAALGVMDERSLVSVLWQEIGREQQVLAEVLATELRSGITNLGDDGPMVELVGVGDGVWRFGDGSVVFEPRQILHSDAFLDDGDYRLLLWSGATRELRLLSGDLVSIPSIAAAATAHEGRAWLTPSESSTLGFSAELAIAGLARVDARRLGDWTLAVVSSIQRHRGRESRRYARTIVVVGLASLVVIGFGSMLLRTQRQERALERALTREALRAQQEAQLAREARAATMLTFAAGIAHELSTPLGVIAMRAEQLEDHAEDARARHGAHAIGEQVAKIRDQARRFLAIARGAAPLRERFSADETLSNAATWVRHRFEAAGVGLVVAPVGDLRWVHGDARLLEHALTNLLINACDASPPGESVELVARREKATLTIEVRDRGAGVDPALAARVRPFFSTKAEGEGTGLGLAIAVEVVRMHRGTLTLAARPGGGTSAVLTLPAEPAPSTDVLPHQAEDEVAAGR